MGNAGTSRDEGPWLRDELEALRVSARHVDAGLRLLEQERASLAKRAEEAEARARTAGSSLAGDFAHILQEVTHPRLAEQALLRSERKYRTLFDHASDAIFLMREGRWTECNDRAVEVFARPREQVLDLPPYAYAPAVQPDGRASTEKALEKIRLALTQGPQRFEWEVQRADGGMLETEVSLKRVDLDDETVLLTVVRDISERKRAEQRAGIERKHMEYLSQYASDFIILLDHDFRFLEVNDRVVEGYGYPRADLIGMHAAQLRAPETQAEFDRQAARARTHGNVLFETVHQRKDGSTFPVEINMRAIGTDGDTIYQSVIRDITERKKMEEALRTRDREYRELVMLANSIILRWAPDGRATFLNEFGQRFFGYSADEFIGRHVLETIVPCDESTGRDLRRLMEEICANPKSFERNTNENVRRDGERVWIDWTNKVVQDDKGQIREILSIGSDVTERKRAEEELVRYRDHLEEQVKARTRELAAAKERAESADRLKSVFLATMSHELRTPLNSIIGFSGILLQGLAGPVNAEQHKQLGMLCNSAEHLLALINDVLDLSKIEAGQLQIERESFDLGAAIRKVVDGVRPQAERQRLALELVIAPEVASIRSDQRRVEQVLLNLLSNAIKFTDAGLVRVEAARDRDAVCVRVTDTGMGIKDDDKDKLFRPFSQIDPGITKRHEGTGLGLSICKRLVELLGGQIWVTSEWGKGSTFGFELPREREGVR